MKILATLFIILFVCRFSFAQKHCEYKLELTFISNVAFTDDNGNAEDENCWKLEKFETSCKLNNLEYIFTEKDSLLLKYFKKLKEIFRQYEYIDLSAKAKENEARLTARFFDGFATRGWFKSDSIDRVFGFYSQNSDINPLHTKILDTYFNIAWYLINKPSLYGKISKVKLSKLEYDEVTASASMPIPIRLICDNPLTYRLKGKMYEESYNIIIQVLNSLPTNKSTYLEVLGDFYIDPIDSFYKPFKEFVKKSNKIIWIPDSERIRTNFKALGVPKRNLKKVKIK
jgi:hypothetical protein